MTYGADFLSQVDGWQDLWWVIFVVWPLIMVTPLTYSLSKRDVDYAPLKPAALWRRILAGVVDTAILAGILIAMHRFVFAATFSVEALDLNMPRAVLYDFLMLLVLAIFVFPGLLCSPWRGTVGMKLFGVSLVDEIGEKLSFGKALLRQLGVILTLQLLGLGYLVALFTQRSQTLHDLMAKTLVVRSRDL